MMEILYLLIPLQVMVLGILVRQAAQIGKLCGYITRKGSEENPDNNAAELHDLEDK
jgi:hypothetical protein